MYNNIIVPKIFFLRVAVLCAILILFWGVSARYVLEAEPVALEADTFSTVNEIVQQKDKAYQAEQVLIVLDIDNTLLTTTSDLGGDIWYRWQRGKFEIKPTEAEKVPLLFEDTIRLLYDLVPMELVEENTPQLIDSWQGKGHSIFALTSRAPDVRSAAEREMLRNGIDLRKTALRPKGSLNPPLYREKLGRNLSYMQGIMMTSGMNKGEMLQYILDKTGRDFKSIIFVDDSEKNVKNVIAEFGKPENSNIDLVAIHFTKIENDRIQKNGTVLTKSQAKKMARDWKKLYQSLNSVFPARKTLIYSSQ